MRSPLFQWAFRPASLPVVLLIVAVFTPFRLAAAQEGTAASRPTFELKSDTELRSWIAAKLTGVVDSVDAGVGVRGGAPFESGGPAPRNFGPDQWVLSHQLPGGAVFRGQIDPAGSVADDIPRIYYRVEWYEPIGETRMLSQRIGYDLNCGRNQVRQVNADAFFERNLVGLISRSNSELAWEPAADNLIVGPMWREICVEARPRRGFIYRVPN